MAHWQGLALGLILAAAIAWSAHRLGGLNRSGSWMATFVGGLTFGLGGWQWGVLLVGFFVSSSLLSRLRGERKAQARLSFAKGEARDWGQVLANGGWGALLSLASLWAKSPLSEAAFLGAMAAAAADTWATELGTLSASPPRLIISGRLVPAGTSGAVSPLGLGASLAGSLFMGLLAAALTGLEGLWPGRLSFVQPLGLMAICSIGGIVGSLADSLLGATLQGLWYCELCQRESERRVHSCGARTRPLRGMPWVGNDLVNFLASLAGSLAALAAMLALA